MSEFLNEFFAPKENIIADNENIDKVINEAILLENLGDVKEVKVFFDKIGPYATRDNLLFDKPQLGNVNACPAHKAAVIAMAKEANDPDYLALMRLCEAKKAYIAKLEEKYGNRANIKIAEQTQKLNNNARVLDAVQKTNGATCINPPCEETEFPKDEKCGCC